MGLSANPGLPSKLNFLLGVLTGLKTKPVTNHHYLSAKQGGQPAARRTPPGRQSRGRDSGPRKAWRVLKQEGDESLGGEGGNTVL